ncbi:MAG: DNA-formamidopyrimidine glycosylase family protein [Verrucomicrobiota bacterium]|nr:DNA-formamidopyrimidine glycosylase family protein [Verrucomicrobiota bacterium]
MPELGEVEYYRRCWDIGTGKAVLRVHLNAGKRIFRDVDTEGMLKQLPGKKLVRSEASGKQMLFKFGNDSWLGIHLGMSGTLSSEKGDYTPGKHDHLVLFQKGQALVFNDPRQFGRVRFDQGSDAPLWWSGLAPAIGSSGFTLKTMKEFVGSHGKLSIKSILLLQEGFPGVGNWMADEILWQAKINPNRKGGQLTPAEQSKIFQFTLFVCAEALKRVPKALDSLPADWLFHERWKTKGNCPKHRSPLVRDTIGGRTTAWCPKCQK